MHQIKLFMGLESSLQEIEKEVNDWLAEHAGDFEVKSIDARIAAQGGQSTPPSGMLPGAHTPSEILVSVHYLKI